MHRQPLLEMLERYQRRFPDEAATVARIRGLVERHDDCFERTCLPGHITGSAWVVSADRQRVLLVHHRKLEKWLQPGGHADGQTDVSQAALREAMEESGIANLQLAANTGPAITPLDVDVHLISARVGAHGEQIEPDHEHYDIRFLVVATDDAEPQTSDESHAVGWFTAEEVRELTQEESVLRMLRKAAKQLGANVTDQDESDE